MSLEEIKHKKLSYDEEMIYNYPPAKSNVLTNSCSQTLIDVFCYPEVFDLEVIEKWKHLDSGIKLLLGNENLVDEDVVEVLDNFNN